MAKLVWDNRLGPLLVSETLVLPIKGEAIPPLWPRFAVGLLVNGTWGFGTALLLRLLASLLLL